MVDVNKYSLHGSAYKTNWALLALIFVMPLRNIQLQYIPNFGGGVNIINILFLLSLVHSVAKGRTLDSTLGLNGYLKWYVVSSIIALLFGYGFLGSDASGHWKAMKDQLIPIFLVFIVQRSAGDMVQWRRILLACLLPLPYMFKTVWNQYMAVSQYHYSDDLRVSGTFMDLGANEMAAYAVTSALVCLGCIITCWQDKKYRNIFLMFFAFSGMCVLYSYSRGAYISFIFGGIILLFRYKNTGKLVMPLFLILSITLVSLPSSVTERFSSIDAEEGERDESAQSRFVFWAIAFDRFLERPVAGYGYRTVQNARINPYEMDTHNYYVKMLVERGVLGFITFLLLLRILWTTIKINLDWDESDNIVNGLMLGMGGALAALMLGNMFGDRFSHYPVMTSFWVYISLISVVVLRRNESMKASEVDRDF
jgi:putative inorganic carbon (HCO3(-)) transporter